MQGFHCLLDVSLGAVERLQREHIYPILVYIQWRSPKQVLPTIRLRYSAFSSFGVDDAPLSLELKDVSGWLGSRLGTKASKELLEKLPDTDTLMAGVNAHLCKGPPPRPTCLLHPPGPRLMYGHTVDPAMFWITTSFDDSR